MALNRLGSKTCLIFAMILGALASPRPILGAPTPEIVTIVTHDGVQLRLTYYPSAHRKGTPEAKQVAPVLLLHDRKETRAVFNSLALRLQATSDPRLKLPSFSAISVDLRGHGESTKLELPNGLQGEIDAAKLNKQGLLAMTAYDMEAIRSFIVGKNDAGELNLNKLCIVGAGMGASVGVNWALRDWAAPPLAIGKQGQDVKGMVLISPKWSYNGLSFQGPMKFGPLKKNLAWQLIYGAQDPKMKADIERIEKQLERFHPQDGAAKASSKLQVVAWPSKLQGGTLLSQIGEPIDQKILDFLTQHVAKVNQPWTNRLDRVPKDTP